MSSSRSPNSHEQILRDHRNLSNSGKVSCILESCIDLQSDKTEAILSITESILFYYKNINAKISILFSATQENLFNGRKIGFLSGKNLIFSAKNFVLSPRQRVIILKHLAFHRQTERQSQADLTDRQRGRQAG